MKKGDNIEELFKDAFDNYEVDPGNQLWNNIQADISTPASSVAGQAATAASKVGSAWLTTAIVGSAIVITSIAGYYYFENKAEARKEKAEKVENIIERPAIAEIEEEPESSISDNETQPKEEKASPVAVETEDRNTVEKKRVIAVKPNDIKPESSSNTNIKESELESESSAIDHVVADESESKNNTDQANVSQATEETTNGQISSSNDQSASSTSSPNTTNHIEEKEEEDNNLDPSDPNTGTILPPKEKGNSLTAVERFKPQNVFSPNGDGINDIFQINSDSLEALGVEALEVKIFSASTGKLIHQWNDLYGFWDGRNASGIKATPGTYFYQMVLTIEGKEVPKTGTVTLSAQ